MTRTTRHLMIVAAFVILTFVNAAAQVPTDQMDRGGQWLSWNQKERITYVFGFIDGYYTGTFHLCEGADDLFKVRDPHRVPPHPDSRAQASIVCLDSRSAYSKEYSSAGVDFSPYVDIITEFYTKHPDYNAVPFPKLMLFLGDGKCNTADELYQKAVKGELPRVR
jgi:hypothetical protein